MSKPWGNKPGRNAHIMKMKEHGMTQIEIARHFNARSFIGAPEPGDHDKEGNLRLFTRQSVNGKFKLYGHKDPHKGETMGEPTEQVGGTFDEYGG